MGCGEEKEPVEEALADNGKVTRRVYTALLSTLSTYRLTPGCVLSYGPQPKAMTYCSPYSATSLFVCVAR